MITGQGVQFLDGDFKNDWPEPEVFAFREGLQWYVVKRGPRYNNTYKVATFDKSGEAWLLKNDIRQPTPAGDAT